MFWSTSILLVIASLVLILLAPGAVTIGLCMVGAYAIFNLARVAAGRVPRHYIRPAANRTAMWLAGAAVVLVGCLILTQYWSLATTTVLLAVSLVQLVVATVLVGSVRRQLRKSRLSGKPKAMSSDALPTVTVAVPARNEGGQLEACLTAILASDYPKLEILALDDGSEDRTPEIIRQFAQRGVRFIRGPQSAAGWLPKNRAYAELVAAASGEYVLFCGSDVRLAPDSIRRLVETMVARHKTMLSIVPENATSKQLPLLQAIRYYWEIAPPRRLFRRPPVLASCWMTTNRQLQKAGGFEAVRRSVSPEAHFAYQAMADDGYSFLRSSPALGITSEKSADEQRETAIYSRYPQLHRRPEVVALLTVAETVLLLGTPVTALLIWATPLYIGWLIVPITALLLHTWAFAMVQTAIFNRLNVVAAGLQFLPAVIADIYYMHFSMYRYEFGRVLWKGRDVAAPVMRKDQ